MPMESDPKRDEQKLVIMSKERERQSRGWHKPLLANSVRPGE